MVTPGGRAPQPIASLAGRTALVTAGSRGLGAEVVRTLIRAGVKVCFTYREDRGAAETLVSEVVAAGGCGRAIQADARDFAAAHAVVGEVVDALGHIDALVCNAGVARSGALWQLSEADWDDVIDVSLKGSFNYVHAIAPYFIAQRSGRIVCIGSINGLRGRVGTASYNAAKAGLVGLVKSAAAELGRFNVTANLVAPGFIETPSQRDTPELIRDLVLKECAVKHLGTPADIAPIVAFLCSDESRHVTGQTIKVDGGQYL